MRVQRRHHVLFNIRDDKSLRTVLTQIAATEGITFRPVRTFDAASCQQPPDQEGDTVPVWRWSGTAEAFRAVARTILNEVAYPLARSCRGGCLALPFAPAELTPRPLQVQNRHLLDAEDVVQLFDEAPLHHGLHLPAAADSSLFGPTSSCGAPRAKAAAAAACHAAVSGLDPDQQAAALHGQGPARVLAAAGSGKTKTMVARIATLVAGGASPGSILVLAFNTKAALQLEERLADAGIPTTRTIAPAATGVHCATFNAFGSRFQRHVLGLRPGIVLSSAVHDRLLRAALCPGEHSSASPTLAAISTVSTGGHSRGGHWRTLAPPDPYDAAATDAAREAARALQAWRTELRPAPEGLTGALQRHAGIQVSGNLQSFDDQVLATVVALLAEPRHRRLLQRLYRYVLVDEFQDVNPAQWTLLDIVSRPWRNLFVVGDDDQLIYGWRSARVNTIIDFGAGLPAAPFTAYYTLPTNYRCSREIVARAERLVLNNRRRAQKSMRPRPNAPHGAVLFAAAAQPQDRCLEAAAFLSLEQARLGCHWHDLAVLCRYRSQLQPVADSLLQVGVPACAHGDISAAIDATYGELLRAALQQAAADRRQASRSAAAVLEDVIGSLEHDRPAVTDDVAWLEVTDAARLLVCDHPSVDGLARAWSDLAAQTDAPRRSSDAVTMATIHATKGREYHSVVIIDFAPALEPLDDNELEEERRVLYVAVTRARHRALLTIDATRGAPHPFVLEMLWPPDRAEARRLRAELARLRHRMAAEAVALPEAAALLLCTAYTARPETQTAATSARTAAAAADYLAIRSRLNERRLAARPRLRELVAAWLG